MDLTVKGLQLSEAILQEFGLGEAPYVNPQEVALQKLLAGATEPWEKEHYKWRINRLKDQTALAGEPGAGNGPPVDSKGNLIPVLPAREWIKKNPNIVKEMPNEALPPELRKPSMLDKIGGAVKGIRNSIVDYAIEKLNLINKYDKIVRMYGVSTKTHCGVILCFRRLPSATMSYQNHAD